MENNDNNNNNTNNNTQWISIFSLSSEILNGTYSQHEKVGTFQISLQDNIHNTSVIVPTILEIETHFNLQIIKNKLSNILIIMCQGGYFSAGYFEGTKNIIHKSFHRVISKKITNKKGNNSKNNKNEKGYHYDKHKHKTEINELLGKWKEYISNATIIYIHAPAKNRGYIMGSDKCIHNIKFKFK